MSSAGRPGLLQQVERFWSMLDELSQDDPEAYRSLVGQQMRVGAEMFSAPRRRLSLHTHILEPQRRVLYINVCSWSRVPPPRGPGRPPPLCAGRVHADEDKGRGAYTVLDVALNPAALHQCGRSEAETEQVCLLALSFAQQQLGSRCSQLYTVISCSPVSSPHDVQRRLGLRQPPRSTAQPPAVAQTSADLLQQITSLRLEEPDVISDLAPQPTEVEKKNLIEVLSSTSMPPPPQPRHRLEVKSDATGVARSLELLVELPEVQSMSECQLQLSEDSVSLEVGDTCSLLLDLPVPVDVDSVSATFNKETSRLTVKVSALRRVGGAA